jgi:DNA-binding IscR family transcriptional regulator
MICATEGEMSQVCNFLDSCRTKYLWARVRDAVAQALDSITLADLAEVPEGPQVTAQFITLTDIHVATSSSRKVLDTP